MGEQLDLFAQSVATPTPLIDPAPSPPPDQQFRDIVANQLHTNLFIGAGAGSGKTTALVARVVNLVRSGVPIGEIAAITFTEKAAAELRHRIREALADPQAGPQADEPAATMMAAARKDLDHAPIGTLHAFANRVLADFPIEASLPPRFEVLDEVSSANAFNERYDDFLEDLLDSPQAVRLVELCDHDGFKVDPGIRRMAEDFQANWDLVAARVSPDLPSEALPRVEELVALCDAITAFDVPPNDTMAEKAARVALARTRLTGQQTLSELLHELNELAKLRGSGGNKATWKKYGADEDALPAMRASMADLGTAAVARIAAFNEERRYILGAVLRRFTLDSVAERQAQGKLEFHDLLVLARRLAFENHGVRRALHDRYTRLLLDEFQDTDPIQLDLAVRIAADPEQPGSQWNELQPLPGRLCLVGDPKQSIYRFRRADISQFLDAASTLDAESVTLSANFRSTPAVIDWVNQTMSALIIGEDHVQPQYVPLAACRTRGIHPGSVTVLGAEAHDDLYGAGAADELRTREAGDVADVIVQALSEGWLVGRESEPGGLGPCRPGDITVLLPARTSLNALEVALAERGIAHRAENSSLVYAAPEIRSLLLALRAADDPTDELAIVSVLRSTLFGCSDRELYDWHATHGRRWTWRDEAPQHLNEHPVAVGLAALGEVAAMIPWSTPSQLLTHLASRRAVLELALADEHSRDIWRRVRFVIDQARAWSEAGGHGVRHYLAWTRLQGEDGRFVAETVLPETDHDAVRIMTVHAAKGLEFPITIVSGLTSEWHSSRGRRVVWPEGTWSLSEPTDAVFQAFTSIDEQMSDAERRRLLYVATTRAKDHLVVSLHRSTRARTSAAVLLAEASEGATHNIFRPHTLSLPTTLPAAAELAWADEDSWAEQRDQALRAASTSTVLSATALAAQFAAQFAGDPGFQKDAVDLDLPPWQRGRYGTAIGRAVHAVLQYADLLDGRDLAKLSAAQAAAEGVIGKERTIERLARSALAAPVVASGCRREHWRELFVATGFGTHVIEGYIDLLVRDDQGELTVVDYKTDQLSDAPDRSERLRRYGVQLAAYGIALEKLLGEPVRAGVLVLCRVNAAAQEHFVADWQATKDELRARLLLID